MLKNPFLHCPICFRVEKISRQVIIFQLADVPLLENNKYHDITVAGVLVAVSNKFTGFIKVCFFVNIIMKNISACLLL